MSDNANQQKKDRREWTIFNLFMQSYSNFPIGNVDKSECPDFIVSTQNADSGLHRIGIELTELKYERKDEKFNMRAHEDYLTSILNEAESFFCLRHDTVLNVDVNFSDSISPLILNERTDNEANLLRAALAETISCIVEDNLPESTGKRYVVDRKSKYGDVHLPLHIESITITNMCGRQDMPLWYASMSTHIKPLTVESVSQRIKDKDDKLLHYNSSCDEFWLIIIQNSFLMSNEYNAADAHRALHHRYRSNFSRVFVFERSEAKVNTLELF